MFEGMGGHEMFQVQTGLFCEHKEACLRRVTHTRYLPAPGIYREDRVFKFCTVRENATTGSLSIKK